MYKKIISHSFLCTYSLCLYNFGKKIGEKTIRKMLVKFTKKLDDTHEIRTSMCEHFEKVCKCDLCSVEVKPQRYIEEIEWDT